MSFDKCERLKVLLYEYYFFNSAKYDNNVSMLYSRLNYKKPDKDLLYKLHNAIIEKDTFDKVMSDILDLLSFYD